MSYQDTQPPQLPGEPAKKRGSGGKLLIGCLVAFVLLGLLCGGGAFYLITNAKRLAITAAAAITRAAVGQVVANSDLREEDKRAIMAQVDRVADAARAGKITGEQFEQILKNLAESPLMTLGIVLVLEEKYVRHSALSDEEKQQARRTLRRVAQGVYQGKINQHELDSVTGPISSRDKEGNAVLKDKITTEELRTVLDGLKTLADNAQIEQEPPELNIGEEFKKAVDQALQGN